MKTNTFLLTLIVTGLLQVIANPVSAQIDLANIFENGMVLQRNQDIPIWGNSIPGDTIFIRLEGTVDTTYADTSGNWHGTLPAMEAGGPYDMRVSNYHESILLRFIYIGDVWLCSGQSNMEMTVSASNNASETISNTNNPTIRQCKISKGSSDDPDSDLPSIDWTPATSSYVGNFSAVGYYFAEYLQPQINDVPIGILNVSYGGSRIEAWMSDEMLGYDEQDITLAGGETERQPTLIYNKMMYPLLGYPIKGFLWYQGESNADNLEDAKAYGELFKTMINSWREGWDNENLPFIWIQLPNQGEEADENSPGTWDAWPQLRVGQSRALALPNTGEVITIDVGEVDIHPKEKEPVGERAALVAAKVAYGKDTVYSGPRYNSHIKLENGSVKIAFDHIADSLVATNTSTNELKWFACADSTGTFYKADAVIANDSVIVSCPDIQEIEMIRYAWEYNPVDVNFYNSAGLPAAPFKIYVDPQPFQIKNFSVTDTLIERGQTIYMEWETAGASQILINNVEKSNIGASTLMPLDTIIYELMAINESDDTLRQSIPVNVIDPLPIINLKAEFGPVYPPNEEIKLLADAHAPAGGTVVNVQFFIDDELQATDTDAPYELLWTPGEVGTYEIKAIVTNGQGATQESKYTLYINDLERVRFEAESAESTGDHTIKSSSAASKNKYLDLQGTWTVSFEVEVPEAGDYQTIIAYLLNYEAPKEQYLLINNDNYETVRFEADDITQWMTYGISLPLEKGINTISFTSFWGWMSFDYVDVLGAIEEKEEVDTTQTSLNHSYTNPLKLEITDFYPEGIVTYTIPNDDISQLTVYDLTGQPLQSYKINVSGGGSYSVKLNKNKLTPGIYFLRLSNHHEVVSQKVMIE